MRSSDSNINAIEIVDVFKNKKLIIITMINLRMRWTGHIARMGRTEI
jgi:hypothetical protein